MAGQKRLIDIPSWESGTIFGPQSSPKQDVYSESAVQNFALGTRYVEGDRTFRYAKAGIALNKAEMSQTQVVETKTEDIAQTGHAWAAGDTSGTILCTTGTTFIVNEFSGGWLYANGVNRIGDVYRVIASEQQTTDTIINVELDTPIRSSLAAATEVTLHPSRFFAVVPYPTTPTGIAAGVSLLDITADYFFWAQTGGPAAVLADAGDALVAGNAVGSPGTAAAAGTCGVRTTLFESWGNIMHLDAGDNQPALINLHID